MTQYNKNNPSVKRIMQEVREMEREKSTLFRARPLEENLFEWHFTIRGPSDTAFEGGRYHGRILLPSEYPFKPPNIILLTPNGRFEVGKKICLSISAHHPEYWQPGWSIRTVLIALIGFMPTKGEGAIAALDYTDEERKSLAQKSLDWQCDKCGSNRFALPESVEGEEEVMEEAAKLAVQSKDTPSATEGKVNEESSHVGRELEDNNNNSDHNTRKANSERIQSQSPTPPQPSPSLQTPQPQQQQQPQQPPQQQQPQQQSQQQQPQQRQYQTLHQPVAQPQRARQDQQDKFLDYLIYAILFAIVALVTRKFSEV